VSRTFLPGHIAGCSQPNRPARVPAGLTRKGTEKATHAKHAGLDFSSQNEGVGNK
jgi:hypothetical protein